jgi:hypothetical protein
LFGKPRIDRPSRRPGKVLTVWIVENDDQGPLELKWIGSGQSMFPTL